MAGAGIAIEVLTKDCTALSDSDFAEMADLCEAAGTGYEIGVLSKQAEEWVLITLARCGEELAGFSYCTLERIGGTPSVLLGFAVVARRAEAADVLAAIMGDQFHRAVLAFPDEDVLIGTRMPRPDVYAAYGQLVDLIPRPDHKASGEERAWGRRLVKRFGVEAANYDDRAFVVRGDGEPTCQFDYVAPEGTSPVDAEFGQFFDGVDPANGDVVIGFGWALAEFLDSLQQN
jgi:hypothetical protein